MTQSVPNRSIFSINYSNSDYTSVLNFVARKFCTKIQENNTSENTICLPACTHHSIPM